MAEHVVDKEYSFPVSEYRSRVSAAQKEMQQRGLDYLLVHTPENIFYLSGYQTPGYSAYQCLIVSPSGEPILILRNGEIGNAKVFSWLDNLETYFDGTDPAETTEAVMQKLDLSGRRRIGVELSSWFLTARVYLDLEKRLQDHEWVDASGTVEACRIIKSEREIGHIREAVRVAEAGMTAAIDAVEEGKLDNDVAAALNHAMFKAGGEYPAYGPFVALGQFSSIMHGMWNRRVIQKGQCLVLEIGGVYHRYNGAIMRTVSIGTPSKRVEAMAAAVDAANSAVITGMAPGATTADLHGRAAEELERHGFGGYRKGRRCGYGIGIAFWPDWGEGHFLSMIDKPNTTLREGMVMHLPLSVRELGEVGIAFSETVVVTATGYEKLTTFERKLFIR